MGVAWDVMVIGAGASGLSAARAAAAEGASRVALVERDGRLGGECLYTGCVPSKALIEAARRFRDARQGERFGLHASDVRLDFGQVMAYVGGVIADIGRDDAAETLSEAGIEVLTGVARFTGIRELQVDGASHTFEKAVVATGSDALIPGGLGLESVPHLTNDTVFDLEALPARLAVLGGGPLGLELGQAFAHFGSEVTIMELLDQLLQREDPRAGQVVHEALLADGVDVRLSTKATGVTQERGGVRIRVEGPDGQGDVDADALLVAVGRRPRSDGFGLRQIGVAIEEGRVVVDERMRTSVDGIYACGDVTGGFQFTHVGAYEGVIAGRNAAGKKQKADYRVVPWVTFTDPEVGRVGLTEEEARREHSKVEVTEIPMSRIDRARVSGRTRGFVKLITAGRPILGRLGGGMVVGAQVVGPCAGEILHEAVLAMQTKCFSGRLAQAIHAYPTGSMGLQMAALQLFPIGRALVPPDELPPVPGASPRDAH
ncbi:MAG: FAD-dependent oxidoreductase [Thermoleophilia bacterium]|nr:FAD-dependent oxidoreductase [Thermoleophilia bacterium]MDH3724213.1 FAD-dependent oxidoreductase [Thermoleophilia bacterium]